MTRYFLAKTDPETYSIDDLAREQKTVWDGVKNPQAVAVIKLMQPDDMMLIYHSQSQAAIVGLAKVNSVARPDPQVEKSWVVDVEFVRKFAIPITLSEIKQSGLFDDWALVRQGRLSTMTVPDHFIEWLKARSFEF